MDGMAVVYLISDFGSREDTILAGQTSLYGCVPRPGTYNPVFMPAQASFAR
jgi:hypothetical protein